MADIIPIFEEDDAYDRECIKEIVDALCDRPRHDQKDPGDEYDGDINLKKSKKRQATTTKATPKAKAPVAQTVYEWAGIGEADRCEVGCRLLLAASCLLPLASCLLLEPCVHDA